MNDIIFSVLYSCWLSVRNTIDFTELILYLVKVLDVFITCSHLSVILDGSML